MHPVEHRGLRELHAMGRQLRDHWRTLARRLDTSAPAQAQALLEGSDVARTLLVELTEVTAERGIHGRPMAQGLGAQLARVHHTALDTTLEINQALRVAVLDVVHVVVLLDFLATAAHDADPELAAFLAGWAVRLRVAEDAIRVGVVALGEQPDLAVRPSAPGIAGSIGQSAAHALGTFGEWFDRRSAR
jgi:hypothetical protein